MKCRHSSIFVLCNQYCKWLHHSLYSAMSVTDAAWVLVVPTWNVSLETPYWFFMVLLRPLGSWVNRRMWLFQVPSKFQSYWKGRIRGCFKTTHVWSKQITNETCPHYLRYCICSLLSCHISGTFVRSLYSVHFFCLYIYHSIYQF